jgi:aldehyde dehydrogenase (NAD+)
MAELFKNLVDGKWIEPLSGQNFPNVNPADRSEAFGLFPRSDHRDVDRAVQAALRQYTNWRKVSREERAAVLFRGAAMLTEQKEQVAVLITKEVGKVLAESLAEVERAIKLIDLIATEARRFSGEATPSELPDRFAMDVRVPVGVVAAITAWDFPLAVLASTLMTALVAGNTVVCKPAEESPLVATRLVKLLEEAGLPPGTLNLVHGLGEEAGAPLVRHPDVALVAFSGSSQIGREVAIAAAAERKRLSLESAGASAITVMEDADLDLAIDGAVRAAFASSGQRRGAASALVVHRKVVKECTDRLVRRAEALRLGNGLASETDLGPVISETRLRKIHRHAKLGVKEGAKLLTGGEPYRKGECAKGFFYLPTVIGDVTMKMRIAHEEIFGPTVVIIAAADLDEAIAIVNASRRWVSVALYTRDIRRACVAAGQIEAGSVHVNPAAPGIEFRLAFGGAPAGGGDHRLGRGTMIDEFSDRRTLYLDLGAPRSQPRAEK